MPICGSFETERELHRGVQSIVYVARPRTGTTTQSFAITLLQPSELLDESTRDRQKQRFLERAELQKELGADKTSHWAAVHECGRAEGGVYLVSDLFQVSVVTLITGVTITSPRLFNIIRSVVAGLRELEARFGRPHGNLKPANVLIAEAQDIATARVVLTDPLPGSGVRPEVHQAADLRAVGGLIFELVMRQPVPSATGLVVSMQRQWMALGPRGDAWRMLCNRLLNRTTPGAITDLETLAREIELLAPKERRVPPWAWLAAAVPLVAAGVLLVVPRGGGGPPEPPAPPLGEVEAMKDELCGSIYWLLPFLDMEAVDPDGSGADLARLQHAMALRAGGVSLHPKDIFKGHTTDTSPGYICREEAVQNALASDETLRRRVAAAYARYAEIRNELAAGIEELRSVASTYPDGWPGPAALLESLADDAVAYMDSESAAQGSRETIASTMVEAMEVCAVFGTDMQALYDFDDPFLRAFTVHCASELTTETSQFKRSDALKAVRARIAEMVAAMEMLRSAIDVVQFRQDHGDMYAAIGVSDVAPTEEDFNRWRDELNRRDTNDKLVWGLLDAATDPTRGWDPQGRLREFLALQEKVKTDCDAQDNQFDIAADADRISGLVQEAQQLIDERLTPRSMPRKESRRREIDEALARVRTQYQEAHTACTADWAKARADRLSEIRNPDQVNLFGYQALNRIYVDAVRRLEQESGSDDRGFVNEVSDLTKLLDERNQALGGQLTGLAIDATIVAQAEQDRVAASVGPALDGIASRADYDSDTSRRQAWDRGEGDLQEWRKQVRLLDKAYGQIATMLDLAYPLGEASPDSPSIQDLRGRWANETVRVDVASALAGIDARVDALERVETMRDADGLVQELSQSPRPAIRLAAWRRLGAMEVTDDTLDREIRLRQPLDAALVGINDAERVRALRAEVSSGRHQRWGDYLLATSAISDRAQRQQRMEKAMRLMEDLEVSIDGLGEPLEPVADALRFDTLLYDFARSIGTGGEASEVPDEAAKPLVMDFVRNARPLVEQLPGDQRQATGDWLRWLEQLSSGEVESTVPEAVGPGQKNVLGSGLRWALVKEAGPDLDQLVFSWNGHQLTFVLVPTGSKKDPVYVSADEVSLSLFRDVIDAAGQWSTVGELLDRSDKGRRGPRVWEWTSNGQDNLRKARTWYVKEGGWNDANVLFTGGRPPTDPADADPIQYVSPHAALLMSRLIGCRLPTETEWKAALAREMGLEQAPTTFDDASVQRYAQQVRANLRDATWAAHRDFVKSLTVPRPRFADEQIFEGSSKPQRYEKALSWSDAAGWDTGDGVLFFTPIGGGSAGGKEIRDLVGNVAEYVVQDAAVLEALNPGPADAVTLAAALNEADCGVIGGSALSPPELPLAVVSDLRIRGAAPSEPDRRGKADVGFRLAFTATGLQQSLAESVRQDLVAADRYIYPR